MSDKQELAARLRILIGEMRTAGFAELEIESADVNVRMVLGSAPAAAAATALNSELPGAAAEDVAPKPVSVTAERVGVFSYGKQRVEAGAKVVKGQTLGIIKGISIQDQVNAPVSGTIDAVFAQEGEIIDFGRALFSILPD